MNLIELLQSKEIFIERSFYRILLKDIEPKIGDELNMSISKALSRREGYSEDFNDFIDFHFPFAFNDGDNDFWIDIQSGEVKYIDYEDFGYDSNKAIIVSSSFKDFIMNLKSRGNG